MKFYLVIIFDKETENNFTTFLLFRTMNQRKGKDEADVHFDC